MSDVLFYAVGLAAFFYALQLKGLLDAFATMPTAVPAPAFFATAALVPCSHALYAFIWYRPKKFKAICKKLPLKLLGKSPVAVFGKLVLLLKAFQQALLVGFA